MGTGSHDAAAREQISQTVEHERQPSKLPVHTAAPLQPMLNEQEPVLSHVAPHIRAINETVDAEGAQMLASPRSGDLQEPRRLQGSRGQDDLTTGPVLPRGIASSSRDPNGAYAIKQHAMSQRVCYDPEILTTASRPQKCLGRALPTTSFDGRAQIRDTFLIGPVDIVFHRYAEVARRCKHR